MGGMTVIAYESVPCGKPQEAVAVLLQIGNVALMQLR